MSMHQNTPSYEKERKENRAISCFENIVSDIAICIKNEVTFALCCNCKSGEAVNIKDCEIAVPVTITSEVDTWARLYLSHCLCVAACQSDKCEVNYQSCSMLMESLMDFTWQKLNTGCWKDVASSWRYIYSWSSLVSISLSLRQFVQRTSRKNQEGDSKNCLTRLVEGSLRAADMGLLMGAPLADSPLPKIASSLNLLMRSLQPLKPLQAHQPHSPHLEPPLKFPLMTKVKLSVSEFIADNLRTKVPVKLLEVIDDWPALRCWSFEYLRKIAGFRTIPIEVGTKYTDQDWSQELVTTNQFVEQYIIGPMKGAPVGYLAQHQLLDQIPELREDIAVPLYCYSGAGEPRINTWIGPGGTVSPLHQDPDHNILAQVVGHKYIRLYSEDQTHLLYPHEEPMLSNTSQIDVENPDGRFEGFARARYSDLILGPGECVFIPRKCWHYVRSLSPSFSVSFWWDSP